ncbi:basic form of pathogenesis-related protein 1-like [Apium graveolens]|uniref:basic form of pathogenesis-related protein 1-like n=1 Tax=Apium graveolens TaxID=4045 RepID=UPI003D79DB56
MAFPLSSPLINSFNSNHTNAITPQDFLTSHNKARAQVGVGPIKWNNKVAAYAQNYAAQRSNDCKLQHSGGPYGENIAEASWDFSPVEAVKIWVDEKPFYDYSNNKCIGHDCLHYTQVVWRKSINLGCAKVQCKNNKWFFVICNYDPPGNFAGERPY